ncbi:hypothetical protein [Streptomyces lydicamycinicus]|uniref:hypothetical protein n=1 Tax=Streptomyces lydicamycinicus TaxID=1546107 RepID=UPI003C2C17A6
MDLTPAVGWATAHPWPATATAAGIAAALVLAAWRLGHAVLIAALAAMACTAYSADTSWGFAKNRLGMTDDTERIAMFAAAEIALLACGLLARANKSVTATEQDAGTAGVPGVLVWVITSVQVIPAYSESGFVGGTVRAIIGPVMAGLLWHMAMGLEIRVIRPGALSTGLPAMIGRELRERLLSHLGLATRNRDAAQITRDRALARAVRLGSRNRLYPWGRKRCAAALTRAGVATDPNQRHKLMLELSARRGAPDLTTITLPSLWEPPPEPARPRTHLAVTGTHLRAMDPIDAIRQVQAAHPDLNPAHLAARCTEYGLVVSETQVRVATRAGNPTPPLRTRTPDPVPEVQVHRVPDPEPVDEPAPLALDKAASLTLELAPMEDLHPEVRTRVPVLAAGQGRYVVQAKLPPDPDVPAEPTHSDPAGTAEDPLIQQARAVQGDGPPPSIKTLKRELRIGQPKAQEIRRVLDAQVRPVPGEGD